MRLSQVLSRSWLAKAARSLGNGLAGAGLLAATGALTAGCLDRPVVPATPDTTNIFVGQIRQTGVDKIDLLFMIDNSISMADKQAILAEAVPVLLQRLIQPICVNADGETQPRQGGNCPESHPPEFKAVENIHIGIITSSLGHHGSADVCSDTSAGRTPDDRAQLLPSVRTTEALTSWNGQGFLVWDPRGPNVDNAHVPPGFGTGDEQALVTSFADQVRATGEQGCGYEQQLEAWYRFLVDPEPVDAMTNDGTNSVRVKDAANKTIANQVVLTQRAAFLRRDSLLAIIMLTDENDCSILDEDLTQGWLVGYKGGPNVNNWRMPAATASCANPNDRCCRPCILGAADGCPSNEAEGCPAGGTLPIVNDSMNQRCFNQVQRFGINLLYPTWRYVEAITQPLIDPRLTGSASVLNPLYAPSDAGEPGRGAGLVFLAGIVGVPWQDIATDGAVPVAEGKPQPPNSLTSPRDLVYLNAAQMVSMNRWKTILGANGAPPDDPFMIESIDPRMTGVAHPLVPGAAVVAPGGGGMNAINGREQAVDPATRDDLQFACIFDLQEPVPCGADNAAGCDCNAEEYVKNSPLCQYPGPDMDGTQIKAKAYPGVRELQVLKDVGDAGIVASICPKNVMPQGAPQSDPNYGYNPAVAAIIERLKEALTAKCLPRPLDTVTQEDVDEGLAVQEDVGKVPCSVVEVRPMAASGQCNACGAGRRLLEGEATKIIPAVKDYMFANLMCGEGSLPSCNDFCMCEIEQFTGPELVACQTGTTAGISGYCYVDPVIAELNAEADGTVTPAEQTLIDGQNALVANCKETERRVLNFVGDNLPAKDGLAVIACVGASVSSAN